MLHFTSGNMFELPVDIRINTVNCVGVMGAGVALAFKTRHPAMFQAYKKACDAGEVRPGALNIWHTHAEWIINFPTKRHWRENSKYEDIEDGLKALRTYLDSIGRVVRVALPALGCGHGGLDWSRVSKLIEHYLATTDAEVFVFEPADSRRAGALTAPQKQHAEHEGAPQLDFEIEPPSDMVSYPTSPVRLESVEPIGPPHTRAALTPPSSFPTLEDAPPSTTCPVCDASGSVTFTREEERFPYGIAPHTVDLSAVVDKGSCAACTFEFTDWRAEVARDAAVQTYLSKSK